MGWVVGIIVLVVAVIIGALVWDHNTCSKYEMQNVHHDAYTSYYYVGKTMVPQFHGAYDNRENVCVERK